MFTFMVLSRTAHVIFNFQRKNESDDIGNENTYSREPERYERFNPLSVGVSHRINVDCTNRVKFNQTDFPKAIRWQWQWERESVCIARAAV